MMNYKAQQVIGQLILSLQGLCFSMVEVKTR
jgi:hypothetical protein